MRKFRITVNGVSYNVEVQEEGAVTGTPAVSVPAANVSVPAPVPAAKAFVPAPVPAASSVLVKMAAGELPVNAPMPGKIVKIIVKAGDPVGKGDVLLLLEAMKMQNEIVAPAAGTVKAVHVTQDQTVKSGDVLVVIA